MRHPQQRASDGHGSLGLLVEDVASLEAAVQWAARFAADQGLRLLLVQALDRRFSARHAIAVADRALQTARELRPALDVRVRSEAGTADRLVAATSAGLVGLVVADRPDQTSRADGLVLEARCPVMLVAASPGGPVLLGTWRPHPAVPTQRGPERTTPAAPAAPAMPGAGPRPAGHAGTFDPGPRPRTVGG